MLAGPCKAHSCAAMYDELLFVQSFPLLVCAPKWKELRATVLAIHRGGGHGGEDPVDPPCHVCLKVSYACSSARRLWCQLNHQAHAGGSGSSSIDVPI
eukprot:3469393-Amphidinium_carterae.1